MLQGTKFRLSELPTFQDLQMLLERDEIDISSNDLMLASNPWIEIMLIDFGNSKRTFERCSGSDASISYASAEQVDGGEMVGTWTDVWALGHVLLDMMLREDTKKTLLSPNERKLISTYHFPMYPF